MMDLFFKIIDVSDQSFFLIVGLCVIAAALMREILGGIYIAAAAVPIYVFASLSCLYLFRVKHLVVVADEDIEAIIAASVGVTLVFLCSLVIVDIFRSITGWNVKRIIKSRKLLNADRNSQS
ncbi:MAG: hypothetical protein K0U74_15415 [Alphaproteobacteria bacterium]|nr:hypothetical protein [Alphaproteobacteria bacterium]